MSVSGPRFPNECRHVVQAALSLTDVYALPAKPVLVGVYALPAGFLPISAGKASNIENLAERLYPLVVP